MVRDQIYMELRRSIIKGYLKPGERLDIVKLAKHYETSITPLRDALNLLSQEGLVTIKPRRGYYVCQITVRQLIDLFDVREILETAAVQRAVSRISDEQIDELIHDYSAYDDESYDRYIDENRRFHCLIAKATGNDELVQMMGRVHDMLARFMFLAFRQNVKTQDKTHADIIAALRARDHDTVMKAMIDEIRSTRDSVIARVLEEQSASWQINNLDINKPQILKEGVS